MMLSICLAWVFPMTNLFPYSGKVPSTNGSDSERYVPTVRNDDAKEFQSLFNGKNLQGWTSVPSDSQSEWSVKDGIIIGKGTANRLVYLVWKETKLKDFELKLEYRLPGKGNTGIEIRSQKDPSGKRPFQGYHADLGHIGIGKNVLGAWDFHFSKRKELPCPRGTRLTIDKNGNGRPVPLENAIQLNEIRDAQWNSVHIIAVENRFQFFINGKPASAFTDNAIEGRLEHGAIGLQIHDRGMEVHFRKIRLKKLSVKR